MAFEEIIGQPRVKKILTRIAENNRIPHALLFHGPDGVGKLAMALALAKIQFCNEETLYCNQCSNCKRVDHLTYPDLKIFFPAKKNFEQEYAGEIIKSIIANPYFYARIWQDEEIQVDLIRQEIIRWANLKSLEKNGKVAIFIDAHRFNAEAENAFLKSLEEPPEGMTFILLTSKPDLLLPTIISRCQAVKFDPLHWEEIKDALIKEKDISEQEATAIARMSFGSYRRAAELLGEDLSEKQNLMLDMLRTILFGDLEIVTLGESLGNALDRRDLAEILELMTIWFHDALVLEQLNAPDELENKLVFANRIETLGKFVQSFEAIPYDDILRTINLSLTMINQRVQLRLVILNLLYELKRLLRRKTNA